MDGREDREVIVLVDDEDMVLTSLNAYLSLETDYEVRTFLSARAALDYLERGRVDLVISDYLMPEMDGIQFLSRVRDLHPEAPRVILTGYADKENAIKGINEVGLYQYIEKPWDNEDLRLVIRNGLEKRRLLSRLQTKINEINKAYADLQAIQQEILKTFA